MSTEEIVIYEPKWASYCHVVLYILVIAISIPFCNLFYFSFYDYFGWCPFRKYQVNISNISRESTKEASDASDHKSKSSSSGREDKTTCDIETENNTSNSNNKISTKSTSKLIAKAAKKMHTELKIPLIISITASYIYVILQTIFSTFRIGIFGNNRYLNKLTCQCLGGPVLSYIFICGRLFLYLFFIIRAYELFKESHLAYSKRSIWILSIIVIIVSQIIGIPLIIVNQQKDVLIYINDANGEMCYFYPINENSNVETISFIIHGYGALLDITFAIISIYMLINRLFEFININSKHDNAQKQHAFIVLSTKLTVLLFIVVISSQFTIILYLLLPVDFSAILYPLDNVINMYCLFLTFAINEKYYYKYFCGKRCIKICYPFVTSMAMSNNSNCCKRFCSCCTCDKEQKMKQKAVYNAAKQEIELYVK